MHGGQLRQDLFEVAGLVLGRDDDGHEWIRGALRSPLSGVFMGEVHLVLVSRCGDDVEHALAGFGRCSQALRSALAKGPGGLVNAAYPSVQRPYAGPVESR